MKANYEDKIPQATSEVTLGNLYDINKQLMEQMPQISDADMEVAKTHLRTWIDTVFAQKYLMLLCHEQRDYTLFNLDKTAAWKTASEHLKYEVVSDIIECMTNRGTLLIIEDQPDNTWEFWIRNSEGCFVYYLFPYGEAVLEY